jgi:hypothetical protein
MVLIRFISIVHGAYEPNYMGGPTLYLLRIPTLHSQPWLIAVFRWGETTVCQEKYSKIMYHLVICYIAMEAMAHRNR